MSEGSTDGLAVCASDWITIATLGKPRGNRGELTALSLTSHPNRFTAPRDVYIFGDGSRHTLQSSWLHQNTLILKFSGIDSISDAEPLFGAEVRIPASEALPAEPGAYYHSGLIGCEVRDRKTGTRIGRVASIDESAGSGMLVLEDQTMIPFAREICVEIAPERREILIDPPEGLLELNRGLTRA